MTNQVKKVGKLELLQVLRALLVRGRLTTKEATELLDLPQAHSKKALRCLQDLVVARLARKVGTGKQTVYLLDLNGEERKLTQLDRVALRIGRDAVSYLRGTILGEGLDKVSSQDPSFRQISDLDRKVLHLPEPEPDYGNLRELLDELVDAVVRSLELTVEYGSGRGGQSTLNGFLPLSLVTYRRALYLLGHTEQGDVRRLRIDRIVSAQKGAKFPYPDAWDPEAELEPWFGMHASGRVECVVLEFSAHAAKYVRPRRWHHTARLESLADGGVRMVMRTGGMELERFALEWGQHCRVISPPWLRESVIKAHRESLYHYENNTEQVVSTENMWVNRGE